MNNKDLKKLAEQCAKHLAAVALCYRSWENMTKNDKKILKNILFDYFSRVNK